jgi:hypothetical protein
MMCVAAAAGVEQQAQRAPLAPQVLLVQLLPVFLET